MLPKSAKLPVLDSVLEHSEPTIISYLDAHSACAIVALIARSAAAVYRSSLMLVWGEHETLTEFNESRDDSLHKLCAESHCCTAG